MTATGRILDEPHHVYHGQHDKPAFGSGAIKLWITDPELFYHRYVKKDVPAPEPGRAMVIGSVVDELLFFGTAPVLVSDMKTTTSDTFQKQVADNPEKYVVTAREMEEIQGLVEIGRGDDDFHALCRSGDAQVTYRVDMGPFYLQARIDLENANDEIPERVARSLRLPILNLDRLLTDLKTTGSHYGRNSFRRVSMYNPLDYPIQKAVYEAVCEKVTKVDVSRLPFRFAAIAKDGTGLRWYDIDDTYCAATNKVADSIGTLKHRYETGIWDDYEERVARITVPENYLEFTTLNQI